MQKGMHFLHDLRLSSGSDRLQAVYKEIHSVCRLTDVEHSLFFFGGLVEEDRIPRIPLQVQACVWNN